MSKHPWPWQRANKRGVDRIADASGAVVFCVDDNAEALDAIVAMRAEAYAAGQEAMREMCAQDADCGCNNRSNVLSAENKAGRWRACPHPTCAAETAAEIRALPLQPEPENTP